MSKGIEFILYKIIFDWLETHEIGPACNAATAKRLSQRIATRLDRAKMITKDGDKVKEPG